MTRTLILASLGRHRYLWRWGLVAGLALLPVLLYLPSLGAPLERDEGVYATIAQGLQNGLIPYRDLFDNKPPLVYVWYSLSFVLLGENVAAPRIVAAVLLALTTLLLLWEVRLLVSWRAAYLAAFIFALSTGLARVGLHANTEAYMLLPLVGSLVAFTLGIRRRRAYLFFVAGLLAGLAVMTKQVAVWNLLGLLIMACLWGLYQRRHWQRHLRRVGALVVGAVVSVTVVLLPFALARALDDFLEANLVFNMRWLGALSSLQQLMNFLLGTGFFMAIAAPLVAASVLGLLLLWRRRRWPEDYLLAVWFVASAVGLLSARRFYPHYFMHLLPAVAILSGLALYHYFRPQVVARHGLAVFVGLSLLLGLASNLVVYLAPPEAARTVSEAAFEDVRWERDSRALGQYLARNTTPRDTIYVYGRESQIYFYARRMPAARHIYDRSFWLEKGTLAETIEELRRTRPVYIVDSLQEPLYDYAQHHPPEWQRFIQENYEYVGRLYFADVYRLKGSRGPGSAQGFVV